MQYLSLIAVLILISFFFLHYNDIYPVKLCLRCYWSRSHADRY